MAWRGMVGPGCRMVMWRSMARRAVQAQGMRSHVQHGMDPEASNGTSCQA